MSHFWRYAAGGRRNFGDIWKRCLFLCRKPLQRLRCNSRIEAFPLTPKENLSVSKKQIAFQKPCFIPTSFLIPRTILSHLDSHNQSSRIPTPSPLIPPQPHTRHIIILQKRRRHPHRLHPSPNPIPPPDQWRSQLDLAI